MKKTIFYSWQSDISEHKKIINDAFKKLVKDLKTLDKYSMDFSIDRANKNESGLVDIANSIFSKIEQSSIFIADLTIINNDYSKRKTPNPNVLIELGYAAGKIGWERILVIFNTEYGKIQELPFDVVGRNIITFSSQNFDESKFIENLKANIKKIENYTKEIHILKSYVKNKVDDVFYSIIVFFEKMLINYDYNNIPHTGHSIRNFLDTNKSKIIKQLKENIVIGLIAFRSYQIIIENLKEILDKNRLLENLTREEISIIINILWIIEDLEKNHTDNYDIPYKHLKFPKVSEMNGVDFHITKNGEFVLYQNFGKGTTRLLEKVKINYDLRHTNVKKYYKMHDSNIEDVAKKISNVKELMKNWFRSTGNYLNNSGGSKIEF